MSTLPRIALSANALCAALATSPLHAQSVMKPGGWQMDSSVSAVSPDGATKDLGRHSMRVCLSAEALDKEPYLSPRIDDAKAPFLLVLSVRGARGAGAAGGGAGRIVVPWFAVGFVAVAGANSLHLLPGAWQAGLLALDNLLLATAWPRWAWARDGRPSAAPAAGRWCWQPCCSAGWWQAARWSTAPSATGGTDRAARSAPGEQAAAQTFHLASSFSGVRLS